MIDARSLPNNTNVETDLCIVGAGTAGITLAREFIGRGFKVCLLESGGLKPDKDTQSLAWGENVGHPYFSLDTAYARFFGGSTNRWMVDVGDNRFGARMRPFDPIDFEKRDWVPYSGWPFDKTHLDPYYDRAQKICKIEPPTFDLDDWHDPKTTPQLPFVGDRVKTVVFKVGLGEPFLKDYLPQVIGASNITTYLYANATEIETDEGARNVVRIQGACLNGVRFSVSAKHFVLAAGGIETPRLLLLSNKTQGNGLGNQYDVVGRFFMEHLHFLSGVFVPSTPSMFTVTNLYNHFHDVKGVSIKGKLALGESVLRQERLLNYVTELVPRILRYSTWSFIFWPAVASDSVQSLRIVGSALRAGRLPGNLGHHFKSIVRGMDEIGISVYRNLKRKSLKTFSKRNIRGFRLATMSEQAPNPTSRITLAADRDRLGKNYAKMDWRLDAIDIQSVVRSQEILKEEIERAGLGRLYLQFNEFTPEGMVTGGWHQMGTTRMHNDPKQGVVDKDCRVHGISNLYIAGPSVFPTGGYANPVLTTVALTVRLADHLKDIYC